jgi:hypothetical protein
VCMTVDAEGEKRDCFTSGTSSVVEVDGCGRFRIHSYNG